MAAETSLGWPPAIETTGSRWSTEDLYQRSRPILFLGPALVLIAVFLVWPLIWIIAVSFTTWNGYGQIRFVGLGTWSGLLSDPTFPPVLQHSLLWMGLAATVPVILGFFLAIIFNRAGGVGAAGRAILIIPLLLPPAVVAVTWQIIYNPNYGPINSILRSIRLGNVQPDWLGSLNLAFWSLCLVGLWSSVGISVLIFTAAIRSIDRSYFDLARVEGAGFWQELRTIVIPACRRSAALTIIITVVVTSQVFDLLYVLTNGGPAGATMMLPLDMYLRAFTGLANVSQGVAEAGLQVGIGIVLAILAVAVSGTHPGMAGEGEYSPIRPSRLYMAAAGLLGLVTITPLFWDVIASFTRGRAAALNPFAITWPPAFSAFATAWNDGIGSGLGQSAAIAVIVVAVTLAVSFPAAFQLSNPRMNRYLRGAVLVILIVTLLQPGEAYLIPLFYLLQQIGLGNTLAGLVLSEIARELPFTILLLWVFMRALPDEVMGAAVLETGRGFKLLWRVVAPLSAPAAAAAALWVFVSSWSEFTLPTVLLSNSPVQTAPMALRAFAGTHDTQFNLLAAGTLLVVIPVVVVLALAYGPAARGLRTAGRALAV